MRENIAWLFREGDLIPTSHRESFVYLEASRVQVKDGRVIYWPSDRGKETQYAFNIPARNVAVLLLGPGCSITTEAMELLCASNVVVGFSGSLGSPLHGGVEAFDPTFVAGMSEYRPTEIMQRWAAMWMDPDRRLKAAKQLLLRRNAELESFWAKSPLKPFLEKVDVQEILTSLRGFRHAAGKPKNALANMASMRGRRVSEPPQGFLQQVESATTETVLLGLEGSRVKLLYRRFSEAHGLNFERDSNERNGINGKLTDGNYIAYGLAASALYTLGVSFAFPLLHGKTRRGGLVFDIADIIKDAIVVPVAFALRNDDSNSFRQTLKSVLMDVSAIEMLIHVIQELPACS